MDRSTAGGGWAGAPGALDLRSNLIRDDITVRLAGESGEGVISSGDILTTGAARTGYWALTFRTYPAEIKGGPCMYQVRIGVEPVRSQGDSVDLLICFNQEAFDLHHHELGRRRAHRLRRRVGEGHARVRVALVRGRARPRSRRRRAATGAARTWSSVGLVCGLLGIDTARIEEMILKRYAHKGDVGESNIRSLRAGFEHARDELPGGRAQARRAARAERRPRARVGQPGDLPRRPARRPRLLRRLPDHAGVATSSSGWRRACRASAASRSRPRTRSPRWRPCSAPRSRARRR